MVIGLGRPATAAEIKPGSGIFLIVALLSSILSTSSGR
jgi:hypothetical protein